MTAFSNHIFIYYAHAIQFFYKYSEVCYYLLYLLNEIMVQCREFHKIYLYKIILLSKRSFDFSAQTFKLNLNMLIYFVFCVRYQIEKRFSCIYSTNFCKIYANLSLIVNIIVQ